MSNVREPVTKDWRTTLQRRITVALVFLGLWIVGIECRLVFLQVIRHADLVVWASHQQSRTMAATCSADSGRVLSTALACR